MSTEFLSAKSDVTWLIEPVAVGPDPEGPAISQADFHVVGVARGHDAGKEVAESALSARSIVLTSTKCLFMSTVLCKMDNLKTS